MVVPPRILQVCSWVDQPASRPGGQAADLGGSPPANSAGLQLGCPAGLDLQNLKGVEEFSSMA